MEFTTYQSGGGIKIYTTVGIGSVSDTTGIRESEHLMVSDPDPIPFNGLSYKICFKSQCIIVGPWLPFL